MMTDVTRPTIFGQVTNPTQKTICAQNTVCVQGENSDWVTNDVFARIDRYTIMEQLGGGSFGCVFRAHDTVAKFDVAVKGLPPLIRQNPEELEKVRENFALVAKLHHPGIASAMHLHQAESVWYLNEKTQRALRVQEQDYLMVMEFVPGVTISSWRLQFPSRRVPLKMAIEVCRQIASALDFAHAQRVIHRDIKPANVMLIIHSNAKLADPSELTVKVLDFGLAAEIRSSMSRVSREQWDTSGTPPYMAPEQWAGKEQGPESDQYALAVLFYELVSGAIPFASIFETNSPVVMMHAVLNQKPEPVKQLTDEQNRALRRALAKDPKNRFNSCTDFIETLSGRGNKRRFPIWVPLVVVVFVASVIMLKGIQFQFNPTSTREAEESVGGSSSPKSAVKNGVMKSTVQPPLVAVMQSDTGNSKDKPNSVKGRDTIETRLPNTTSPLLAQPMAKSAISSNAIPFDTSNSVTNDNLKLELTTFDGRNEYADGEKIGYRIRTSESSHVAVYCVQSDGKIVLLFPNAWNQETWIQGGKWIDVPGPVASGFEIIASPPYGLDVVYVVACSEQSDFHKTMNGLAASSLHDKGFATITESMLSLSKPGAKVNLIKVRVHRNESVINR